MSTGTCPSDVLQDLQCNARVNEDHGTVLCRRRSIRLSACCGEHMVKPQMPACCYVQALWMCWPANESSSIYYPNSRPFVVL